MTQKARGGVVLSVQMTSASIRRRDRAMPLVLMLPG